MTEEIHRQLGEHNARLNSLEAGNRELWRTLKDMDAKLDTVLERMAGGQGAGRMLLYFGAFIAGLATVVGAVVAAVEAFRH